MQYHNPVLLQESLMYLNVHADGVFVDATLGGGGHTEAILESNSSAFVYGIDQDNDAMEFASKRLSGYQDRVTLIKTNFENLRSQLALRRVKGIDGILFDLGVSSYQLDNGERGFSFDKDAIIDMRMDSQTEITAKDLLNTLSVTELTTIFREFGEEQAAYKIAQWIDAERQINPIQSTKDLSSIIESHMRSNPILVTKTKARIFQALRIYLNRELEVLQTALDDAINLLNPKGRMVVITYHSLEDRIVKTTFNRAAKGCICPKTILKCMCNQKQIVKVLTNKAVLPSETEMKENSRSRSAKLRAIEKL